MGARPAAESCRARAEARDRNVCLFGGWRIPASILSIELPKKPNNSLVNAEALLWRKCHREFDDVGSIWPEGAPFDSLEPIAKLEILYHLLLWIAESHNLAESFGDDLV